MLLANPFGLIIGLVAGSVSGGAILALPVLVYVLGEGVNRASTASLIVVALAAGLGGGPLARHGACALASRSELRSRRGERRIGGPAAGSAVDAKTIILAFCPGQARRCRGDLAARRRLVNGELAGDCPETRWATIALAGAGVGFLTGFFGVGGGFLIIPALTVGLGCRCATRSPPRS